MAVLSVAYNVNVLTAFRNLMDNDGDEMRALETTGNKFVAYNSANGYTGILSGSGLTYSQYGVAGGTITSAILTKGNQTLTVLEGASIPGNLDVFDRGYDGNPTGATSELAYWMRQDDTVLGSNGDEYLYGFGGNDRMFGGLGNDTFDGGKGTDTATFTANRSAYQISTQAGKTVVSGPDGIDTFINVERLEFKDMTLALDIDGNAGKAYRLYQAAFDRKPDNGGLKHWLAHIDAGLSLKDAASAFIQSPEFVSLYGSSNPSADVLIQNLYLNVLHREPEQAGYDYWMGQYQYGVTQDVMLERFAESPENIANVIGSIQHGIEVY